MQRTMVVDNSGGWLAAWEARHMALGNLHLRSQLLHHPHPSPLALQQYVEAQSRQEASWGSGGIYRKRRLSGSPAGAVWTA